MSMRMRKLVGTILLLLLVAIYSLLAMVLAGAVLPQASTATEFAFYAIAGLAWVPPAGLLIRWMHR